MGGGGVNVKMTLSVTKPVCECPLTSARGHKLSGRVRAHANNYYAWVECVWVAK